MRLETKRLILRPWKKTDLNDMIEGLNNYNVSKWMALVKYPYTKKDANNWLNELIKLRKGAYEWAIELKSEKKIIGGTAIRLIMNNVSYGGGIWLNTKYQNKGYASEAFGARIKFAFEKLKLRRMENGFFKGNDISWKLQKKFGYKIEGLKRKGLICLADGKYKDEYITGLLKEDWIKKMKSKKKTKK